MENHDYQCQFCASWSCPIVLGGGYCRRMSHCVFHFQAKFDPGHRSVRPREKTTFVGIYYGWDIGLCTVYWENPAFTAQRWFDMGGMTQQKFEMKDVVFRVAFFTSRGPPWEIPTKARTLPFARALQYCSVARATRSPSADMSVWTSLIWRVGLDPL